ncbi:acetoacetate decarboxylase family protein [Streptomyces sp. ISL-96]|uniref:acetoacetate decarboxylase family protein n=1 Tax=Streptomyces sp. ISL-96 TaxID=2819191 RepID=UPI001BED2C99|nr:acetoacetate decarboxylase family protein [Streptomyces sp. ISL-96]MBT2488052.1 acetoacetate decarboxylase family protein [Streptomyces sp. ISL-96]
MQDPAPTFANGYPEAPWTLEGPIHLAQLKLRRPLRPPEGVQPFMSRRMVLLLGRYRTGTLAYSELVLCSYARSGLRVGLVIHHIWVDSQESVQGGRHIWGLAKKLATFAWSDSRVRISDEEGPITELHWDAVRWRLPAVPLPLPFFGFRDARLLHTVAHARARIAPCRMTVTTWSPRLPEVQGPRVRPALLCDPSRALVPAARVVAGGSPGKTPHR